jgi:hypothetical protein
MTFSVRTIRSVLIIIFALKCAIAFGGSSPNVPIDNHVYRDIDKLVSAGLIKDAIYGQRPWSRNEIARMIAEARRRLTEKGIIIPDGRDSGIAMMAGDILERLEGEYHDEITEKGAVRFHPMEEISIDNSFLNSPFREAPENNDLGSIKAEINPLVSYGEGRHYADGGTFALESVHWARPSKCFSIYARPRFEVLAHRAGSAEVNVRVQTLYGKFALGNLEMEVGRDSLIWGFGEHGGVLASNNARNLDMIKISNDSPFVHPWFFKRLGPSKYTFFVANLGPEYVLKNAYLYGAAASFKPTAFLEIGFEHQLTVGGEGSPSVNLTSMIREFLFIRGNSGVPQESIDNREGMNIRVQIPRLHHAVIYTEGVFEDFGRESFWPQFTQQMGFLSGLYFPLLTADGSNDLRIEYENSPGIYGRHGLYASGLTENNILRGSELGPDGQAVHVSWRHLFPSGVQLRGEAHYENRDSDIYAQTLTSRNEGDKVFSSIDNPNEHRFRIASSLDWRFNSRWIIRPQFGYERVWNYDFDTRVNRNNFLGAISLRWFPGR